MMRISASMLRVRSRLPIGSSRYVRSFAGDEHGAALHGQIVSSQQEEIVDQVIEGLARQAHDVAATDLEAHAEKTLDAGEPALQRVAGLQLPVQRRIGGLELQDIALGAGLLTRGIGSHACSRGTGSRPCPGIGSSAPARSPRRVPRNADCRSRPTGSAGSAGLSRGGKETTRGRRHCRSCICARGSRRCCRRLHRWRQTFEISMTLRTWTVRAGKCGRAAPCQREQRLLIFPGEPKGRGEALSAEIVLCEPSDDRRHLRANARGPAAADPWSSRRPVGHRRFVPTPRPSRRSSGPACGPFPRQWRSPRRPVTWTGVEAIGRRPVAQLAVDVPSPRPDRPVALQGHAVSMLPRQRQSPRPRPSPAPGSSDPWSSRRPAGRVLYPHAQTVPSLFRARVWEPPAAIAATTP